MVFRLINLILGLIELLISIRILLRFFGASSASPFSAWIYDTSAPLVAPFAGIFPSFNLGGRFFIDTPALIALIVIALIGSLVSSLISSSYPRKTVIRED